MNNGMVVIIDDYLFEGNRMMGTVYAKKAIGDLGKIEYWVQLGDGDEYPLAKLQEDYKGSIGVLSYKDLEKALFGLDTELNPESLLEPDVIYLQTDQDSPYEEGFDLDAVKVTNSNEDGKGIRYERRVEPIATMGQLKLFCEGLINDYDNQLLQRPDVMKELEVYSNTLLSRGLEMGIKYAQEQAESQRKRTGSSDE